MRLWISIILCFSSAISEKLVIGADLWPPFNGEPNSDEEGILVDIARIALEGKGYTLEYKIIPWSRAIKDGETGSLDILIGAAKTDAPNFTFPDVPQGYLMSNLFYLSDFNFKDLKSFVGKRLGAIQGYTYGELVSGENLDDYISKGEGVEMIGGEAPLDSAIKMLLAGRIDVLIEHPYTFREALRRNNREENPFQTVESVTKPQGLYLAISPKRADRQKIADLIYETTQELDRTGEMRKLKEKYNLNY